ESDLLVLSENSYLELLVRVNVYKSIGNLSLQTQFWSKYIHFLLLLQATLPHPQKSPTFVKSSTPDRKRKRSQEAEDSLPLVQEEPIQKRSKASLTGSAVDDTSIQKAEIDTYNGAHPICYWVHKEYFEQDKEIRKHLQQRTLFEEVRHEDWFKEEFQEFKNESWFKEEYGQHSIMSYLFAKQKPPPSLRRKNSESSLTPSDQQSREAKSVKYRTTRYEAVLETKGSFMSKSRLGITDASKNLYMTLLEKDSIALCNPRPQPDYSVGFSRSAFTDKQLEKLRPYVGEIEDTCTSYFMGTWQIYFPFLTCEVKCGQQALDIADRQNAHSMTLAIRATVELFKLVKRQKELHWEILAFSISHDHEAVRIYGHYPVISEDKTTFYRHPIRNFIFTESDGKEKWTAYKFTKNVYDIWMPKHLERICFAIDEIPSGINFEVSQSELQFPDEAEFQLSQELDIHLSQQSNTRSISALEEEDRFIGSQRPTPNTSFTQSHKQQFKKPRNKRGTS
ncbi:MAG: hypothetical protein MMC33_010838, partial [Icmadophila ericetorum]|nr:hypothetical protein [Icmadophila ericetorum]